MEPERLDLSVLDPRSHPERWEAMVSGVLARARTGGQPRGVMAVLGGWTRPMLAAASFVAVTSAGLLAWQVERHAAPEPITQTLAEALYLPDPVAEWIDADRRPAESDLLGAWELAP